MELRREKLEADELEFRASSLLHIFGHTVEQVRDIAGWRVTDARSGESWIEVSVTLMSWASLIASKGRVYMLKSSISHRKAPYVFRRWRKKQIDKANESLKDKPWDIPLMDE